MDTPLTNYRGITGTVYSDHFYASHGFYYECLFGHPVYGSVVLPSVAAEHFDLMRQVHPMAGFGVMLVDTPSLSNRVEWHSATDEPRIIYTLSTADRDRLRFAARTRCRDLFAAGAREVLLPSNEAVGPLATPRFKRVEDAVYCADLAFTPHQTNLSSSHCQATLKMGEDPATSVVDSRGSPTMSAIWSSVTAQCSRTPVAPTRCCRS